MCAISTSNTPDTSGLYTSNHLRKKPTTTKQKCLLIGVAVPVDHNIKVKYTDKLKKYTEL